MLSKLNATVHLDCTAVDELTLKITLFPWEVEGDDCRHADFGSLRKLGTNVVSLGVCSLRGFHRPGSDFMGRFVPKIDADEWFLSLTEALCQGTKSPKKWWKRMVLVPSHPESGFVGGTTCGSYLMKRLSNLGGNGIQRSYPRTRKETNILRQFMKFWEYAVTQQGTKKEYEVRPKDLKAWEMCVKIIDAVIKSAYHTILNGGGEGWGKPPSTSILEVLLEDRGMAEDKSFLRTVAKALLMLITEIKCMGDELKDQERWERKFGEPLDGSPSATELRLNLDCFLETLLPFVCLTVLSALSEEKLLLTSKLEVSDVIEKARKKFRIVPVLPSRTQTSSKLNANCFKKDEDSSCTQVHKSLAGGQGPLQEDSQDLEEHEGALMKTFTILKEHLSLLESDECGIEVDELGEQPLTVSCLLLRNALVGGHKFGLQSFIETLEAMEDDQSDDEEGCDGCGDHVGLKETRKDTQLFLTRPKRLVEPMTGVEASSVITADNKYPSSDMEVPDKVFSRLKTPYKAKRCMKSGDGLANPTAQLEESVWTSQVAPKTSSLLEVVRGRVRRDHLEPIDISPVPGEGVNSNLCRSQNPVGRNLAAAFEAEAPEGNEREGHGALGDDLDKVLTPLLALIQKDISEGEYVELRKYILTPPGTLNPQVWQRIAQKSIERLLDLSNPICLDMPMKKRIDRVFMSIKYVCLLHCSGHFNRTLTIENIQEMDKRDDWKYSLITGSKHADGNFIKGHPFAVKSLLTSADKRGNVRDIISTLAGRETQEILSHLKSVLARAPEKSKKQKS